MDIFRKYATDERAEVEGTWQTLGDSEFLIARANNRNYMRCIAVSAEKYRDQLLTGDDASDQLSTALLVDALAETVLLDWKNVTYQDKPLKYSKENAKKVLAHRDFRDEITALSERIDAYRAKFEEKQTKN